MPEEKNPLTLISSFYSLESLTPALHQLSPTKLILVVHDGEKDEKAQKTVRDNIDKINALFSKLMKIELVKADAFDVVSTAQKTVNLIEDEAKNGQKVIVNITGGRKILGLGVLFGAYARPDQVERIVYGADFDPALVDLPKMSFNMGNTKIKLLELRAKNPKQSVSDAAEKAGVTPAMAYVHLRELKGMGYVNEKYEITSAGRLALL